jgi:hypothetical protein
MNKDKNLDKNNKIISEGIPEVDENDNDKT